MQFGILAILPENNSRTGVRRHAGSLRSITGLWTRFNRGQKADPRPQIFSQNECAPATLHRAKLSAFDCRVQRRSASARDPAGLHNGVGEGFHFVLSGPFRTEPDNADKGRRLHYASRAMRYLRYLRRRPAARRIVSLEIFWWGPPFSVAPILLHKSTFGSEI
jgi:hypothetical protein